MGAKSVLTDEMRDQVFELRHDQNKTIQHIADRLGVSRGAVEGYCRMYGVERSDGRWFHRFKTIPSNYTRSGHVISQFTTKEDEQILKMDIAGTPRADIARAIGRKQNSVRTRLSTLARNQERMMEAGGQY